MRKLEQIFEGDKYNRGRLWGIDPTTKEKNGSLEKGVPFDWAKHFKGDEDVKNIQGLSPVNLDTGMVQWLGLDVDLKIEPKEFCANVFSKLGTQYFCFRTTGMKWRVVEFLDEPMDVDVAKDRAKKMEERMEKVVGYKCDTGHTLPQSYDLEKKKPGQWWYMPYCTKDTKCYSPEGEPLSKSQFEFREKYKHLPLVVASVGMKSPGRHKAFFTVALCNKHLNANVNLEELNKNFNEKFKNEDNKLFKDIQHAEEQSEKYDKKFFLNGIPKWCKEICGVKPHIDAEGFSAVTQELTEQFIYVRDRKSLFEIDGADFIDRDQTNDWWAHYTASLPPKERKPMTKLLLEDPRLEKVKKYLAHAGLPPGIVELNDNEVKGLDRGRYLNIYKPPEVEAIEGDCKRLNEYYEFAFGKSNWNVLKQLFAFLLNAKEEVKHNGSKPQWFVIIQGEIQGIGKKLFAQICQKMFGVRNVKPNVSFKKLTEGHSTTIEGAQIIFLNEVALSNNTGERK